MHSDSPRLLLNRWRGIESAAPEMSGGGGGDGRKMREGEGRGDGQEI